VREDQGSDLALEALAKIQAMEAEADAVEFRDKWLGGAVFPDWAHAIEWIRLQKPTEEPRELQLLFTVPRNVPVSAEDLADKTSRRAWMERWLEQNPDAAPTIIQTLGPNFEVFDLLDQEGKLLDRQYIEPGSGLEALVNLGKSLCSRYRWKLHHAHMFILLDTTPVLDPIRVQVRARVGLGTQAYRAGAFSCEITLHVRPQATQQAVANAYEEARRSTFEGTFGIAAGERIRPITSPSTAALAILGGRIARGDFASWDEARAAYAESSGETKYLGVDAMGQFRRDTRAAFKKVTGLTLDFQPTKRNRASIEVELIREEGELE
jgi:hypothetical protein